MSAHNLTPVRILLPIYDRNGNRIGIRIANVMRPALVPGMQNFPVMRVRDGQVAEVAHYLHALPIGET